MASKIVNVVRFFHRGTWETFEEYGPTMQDVAIDKAYKLSDPFGDAEVRVVQKTMDMNWEDGILLELITVKNTVLDNHFIRN